MKKLGALCALLLINGQCLEPFNPFIFEYIINDCDLQSLHKHLVGDWHPELRQTIRQWIDMGETGDVIPFRSHFASFHNQSVQDPFNYLSFILLIPKFRVGWDSSCSEQRDA